MFIELIDSLRCTNEHADSWLVASIVDRRERFIIEGTLGCPVCGREYPIQRGVAVFSDTSLVPSVAHSPLSSPPSSLSSAGADDDAPMRAAAFLNVSEGGTYLLTGAWANVAHDVTSIMPLRIFAMNAADVEESEHVGLLASDAQVAIPLAPSSLGGAAFEGSNASQIALASAVRCLSPRGRLVAPAAVPVPAGVEIVARDDSWWIAERQPPLVTLGRG